MTSRTSADRSPVPDARRFEHDVESAFDFSVANLVRVVRAATRRTDHPTSRNAMSLAIGVLSRYGRQIPFFGYEEADDVQHPLEVICALAIVDISEQLASSHVPRAARDVVARVTRALSDLDPHRTTLREVRARYDEAAKFLPVDAESHQDVVSAVDALDLLETTAARLAERHGSPKRGRKRRDELVRVEELLWSHRLTDLEIAKLINDLGGGELDARAVRVGWRRRQRRRRAS